MEDPDYIRTLINQRAAEDHERREKAKKYDKSPKQIVTEREKHRQLQEKEGYEIC
ncbi:hypothetical protein [Rickettsia helvetica]|uniref:DUF3847 domain-containing protein n=1 Tax=Rickettsia helvetica TaxID=35789 RepID=A0ABM9NBB3_RICHE|nr:hypothetical protein [Rickettsia helvetica]MCZ6883777.1 hypothetical protein [Rickettsia endosymbiont of Ixodes ricinus]MCZ6896899.1 hypothetical protein [Rickettsia endosymbiont of Ixodes ricinus]